MVTKPFTFEGRRRREQAEKGLTELRQCVDTVITIPNEKLLHTVERNTTLSEAFLSADDILASPGSPEYPGPEIDAIGCFHPGAAP